MQSSTALAYSIQPSSGTFFCQIRRGCREGAGMDDAERHLRAELAAARANKGNTHPETLKARALFMSLCL